MIMIPCPHITSKWAGEPYYLWTASGDKAAGTPPVDFGIDDDNDDNNNDESNNNDKNDDNEGRALGSAY